MKFYGGFFYPSLILLCLRHICLPCPITFCQITDIARSIFSTYSEFLLKTSVLESAGMMGTVETELLLTRLFLLLAPCFCPSKLQKKKEGLGEGGWGAVYSCSWNYRKVGNLIPFTCCFHCYLVCVLSVCQPRRFPRPIPLQFCPVPRRHREHGRKRR